MPLIYISLKIEVGIFWNNYDFRFELQNMLDGNEVPSNNFNELGIYCCICILSNAIIIRIGFIVGFYSLQFYCS